MATLLYRTGRASYRHRWAALLVWLAVLAGMGAGAATLSGSTTDEVTIPGTEAIETLEELAERFPEAGVDGGGTARVVMVAPEGRTFAEPELQQAVAATVGRLSEIEDVESVLDPFTVGTVAPDGQTAYAQVQFAVPAPEVDEESLTGLEEAAEPLRDAGFRVETGGDVFTQPPEVGPTEVAGVAVALVVLVVTFASLVAAGLTVLSALVGVAVGMAGVLIASGLIELNSTTPILALMLGLAVGIDYALFISFRYRHELAEGVPGEEAAGRAVGTAGSAVVFAGLTVVVALAGLSVVGIPLFTSMGLAASATVVVAVLVALTLLPALLAFAGRRVLPRRQRSGRAGGQAGSEHRGRGLGERWVGAVTRRPLPVVIAGVLGLGVMAWPATDLELSLPDDSTAAADSSRRQAYDLIAEAFGPGVNGPLVVVATSEDPAALADQLSAIATELQGLDDVAAVAPPAVSPRGDTAVISVIPASAPTSPATTELVRSIREDADDIAGGSVDLAVTGQTAVNIDVSQRMADALPVYLLVVVGLALVLLLAVFRSVLVPVKATLGFLLSVAASFGAVVAAFQWGWLAEVLGVGTGPILSMLPILLIGVLFGLAMDYEVFLVSRMREEYVHGSTPTEAVRSGYVHGVRVVAAAAVIMVSVFAGFVFIDNPVVKPIAFGLAFGVLVDAFVVRLTLVPAAMVLLGRAAWWLPRWLDRLLPHVDVEGSDLRAEPTAPAPRVASEAGAREV